MAETVAEPLPDPIPPKAPSKDSRGRWVAILTGALSILIGVAYLVLITVLDSRGPLQPPPPEALVGAVVAVSGVAAEVPPPG